MESRKLQEKRTPRQYFEVGSQVSKSRHVWVVGESRLIRFYCLRVSLEEKERVAAVKMSRRQLRILLNHLIEEAKRLLELALICKRLGESKTGAGIVWIEFEGLLEVFESKFIFSLRYVQITTFYELPNVCCHCRSSPGFHVSSSARVQRCRSGLIFYSTLVSGLGGFLTRKLQLEVFPPRESTAVE